MRGNTNKKTVWPYAMQCEWTRTVNVLRKYAGKAVFPMPVMEQAQEECISESIETIGETDNE